MSDAIALLRKQLQQLKTQHDTGELSPEAYATAKAPLERELLDRVIAQPTGTQASAGPAEVPVAPRASRGLVAGLSAAVLVVAVIGYAAVGSPRLPSAGPPGSATAGGNEAAQDMTEAQFVAAVEQLAKRMTQEPANGEGWALLARSYVRLGRHAEAVPAFVKAVAITGDDPTLLVDYADALAMTNNRTLDGEPLALVERALKYDPDNAKALALAGAAAFNRKEYPKAVQLWERLVRVSPPDSAFLPQLQGSIDEARSLGGLPPVPRVTPTAQAGQAEQTTPAASTPATAGDAKLAAGAVITGTVRLSPALAAQAQPDDVVFIFARPAEGARMPLAIVRHQVKDLPVSFRLDDSMAMSPAMKLSQFSKVVVSARVSKTGQAIPAAGDLSGQTSPMANQAQGLVIEINEVVKN